jgi:hypothetical protein
MKNNFTERYKLLSDGYRGEGGFADGGYLERHPREAPEKYAQRQKIAYYLNYAKPCVDAHVDPIFKKTPNREWSGQASEAWKGFIDDADRAGTNLDALMKRLAQGAKLFGVSYLVIDSDPEPPGSLKALLDEKKYPYAFVVEPLRVVEIKSDRFGRITCFAYKEPDEKDDSKTNIRILTPESWKLTGEYGGAAIKEGKHNLGRVPVVALPSRELDPSDHFPVSDFLSIVRTNLAIYNMSSWLSDILQNQTFSVLTYPSDRTESELVIGTNNALSFPVDARHRPEFIAPPAEPANILAQEIARLQGECYRMAGVVNVTGVRAEASGVAKAWDFERTNETLANFAGNIEAAEIKIAELFSLWLNLPLEYKCAYPSDFSISDIATELTNAEAAKGLNFGGGFDLEVFKRVLTAYLPELPADEFDRLAEEYKKLRAQEEQDRAHEDGENKDVKAVGGDGENPEE